MWACSVCNQTFTRKNNCVKHEQTCTGPKELKCGLCGEVFPDKYRKYRHTKKCTGPAPATTGTVVNNTLTNCNNTNVNTNIDNSTNINSSVVVNVNDFCRTDPRDTVKLVMRNPAPIQLANERQHDKLEEAIAQAVYWGTPSNKNVLGIESHGRHMFCLMLGKRGAIDRNEGTARMMGVVRQVSNAPEVRELLGPRVRLTDLSDVQTSKELAALRARYATVVENGGVFGSSILVPERRPYFVPDAELRDLIIAACSRSKTMKEVISTVCMRFGYADGRWFVGAGGLVNELTEAQVMNRLNDGYDSEEDPTLFDVNKEYKPPVLKKLHPSQEDRTKVGWQLVSNPIMDGFDVPAYFHYIAADKMRLAMNAIADDYSINRQSCDASVIALLNNVREHPCFMSDTTHAVLQAMKTSEGVPVNWDDYN